MPKKILLIDDSRTVRLQVRIFLESAGYQVEEAKDGGDGFSKFHAFDPDALLIDFHMPDMTGLDLLDKIRSQPEGKSIPAFILTTETSKSQMARGKEVGATAWMIKPFKPGALLEGLERVLT